VETSFFQSVRDAILFGLAIYATILSTYNFVQAWRRERRSVVVTLISVVGMSGPTIAEVRATNVGHRPVTVRSIVLELEDKKRLSSIVHYPRDIFQDTPLPHTITDGQSASVFMAYADIGRALIQHGRTGKTKLTPICEDSAGGVHRGKPWDVDPAEFIRM